MIPHAIEFPARWKEPITGNVIPMRVDENIDYREAVLVAAENDVDFQDSLLMWSGQSFEFWCNTFAWTYKQSAFDENGVQTALTGELSFAPWLSWVVNSKTYDNLQWCIRNGRDLVIDKSREQRLTWLFSLVAVHQLLFRSYSTSMLVSRKQDLVDSHNPDAIFPRLRFVLDNLPTWMLPASLAPKGGGRTFMHLGNLSLGDGSSDQPWAVDGESTIEGVGVGGRRTFIGIDEASRNRHLQAIWDATKSSARTRVAWSTPLGPGFFADLCNREGAGQGAVHMTIDYRWHPEMGKNAEIREDDAQGTYTGQGGKRFVWTPWLHHEVEVLHRSRRDIAQNIFVNHDDAGMNAFDTDVLRTLIGECEKANGIKITGDLVSNLSGEERDAAIRRRETGHLRFVVRDSGKGSLSIWVPLIEGRPPQDRAYCMGADVSNGLSGSNSTIKIGDSFTGEVCGSFASAAHSPEEFSRIMAEVGLWFGGFRHAARCIWESNGPGQIIEKWMFALKYPHIWMNQDESVGWWNDPGSMIEAIENLRSAYARGRLIERCADTLKECKDYVWAAGPRIICGRLREDKDALSTHGDRVIATMLMWKLMESVPRREIVSFEGAGRTAREAKGKQHLRMLENRARTVRL